MVLATVLLQDQEDGQIDAILIYESLIFTLEDKKKELQNVIDGVKEKYANNWSLEDIRDALPDGWSMTTRWDNDWAVVYY